MHASPFSTSPLSADPLKFSKVRVFLQDYGLVIVLLVGVSVAVCKHHGSAVLVQLGCILAISAAVSFYWKIKDFPRAVLSLAAGGLTLASPGSHLLYAFWLILLPSWRVFYPIGFALLCSYVAEHISLSDAPYSGIFLLSAILVGTCLAAMPANVRLMVKSSLIVACLVLTTLELLKVNQRGIETVSASEIPFGYRVGDTVQRVLEGRLPASKAKRQVRSLLQGDPPSTDPSAIILVEHDQWDNYPALAAQNNWHQKEPWNENQLLGNQFWLAAIYGDGQFQSNLGGQAHSEGKVLLMSPSQLGTKACLAAERENLLHLGDSDYFCNGMAAYQPALLKEIFGVPSQFVRLRLLSILLLAVGICLELRLLFPKSIIVALCIMMVCFACIPMSIQGDVRIVSKVYDPHEQSRASGVLGALADGEICAVRGDVGAKVLVVAEGFSCVAERETVILLEPGSSVILGKDVISAGDIPLGTIKDNIDARHLNLNGKDTGTEEFTFKGVRLIGTGSPSKNIVRVWPHL